MTFSERDLERRLKQLGPQFRKVYTEAKRDMDKKLENYIAKYRKEDAEKRRLLAAGEITQDQYDSWKMGAVFQGKMWRAKAKQMAETLENADKEALKLIRGEQMDIFAEGFNHEQFEIEKATGASINFGLYDAETVGNLIQNEPELLPRKVVNGKKAEAWNQREIANAVTQGIIQGESVDKIAARIARDTAQRNGAATMRYARTALTGAQNSGRVECMKRAEGMGIKIRKQWLATMDRKTRDSHRHLDGQTVDIDKPFKSDFGLIRFPGDPEAAPGDVYNCRCTLISVYPEYKEFEEDWRQSEEIDGMTYDEWKHEAERKRPKEPEQPSPTIAGVSKGKPMTHAEADTGRVNPKFGESKGYGINCQSCVVTYEARLRGYDVEVVPNDKSHPMCGKLSSDTLLAWKNKDGSKAEFEFDNDKYWKSASVWQGETPTAKRFERKLLDGLDENGRYNLEFKWKGVNAGHIVCLQKDGPQLVIYDPQSNKLYRGSQVSFYLERIAYSRKHGGYTYYQWPGVTRVDDKEIDFSVANQIMKQRDGK